MTLPITSPCPAPPRVHVALPDFVSNVACTTPSACLLVIAVLVFASHVSETPEHTTFQPGNLPLIVLVIWSRTLPGSVSYNSVCQGRFTASALTLRISGQFSMLWQADAVIAVIRSNFPGPMVPSSLPKHSTVTFSFSRPPLRSVNLRLPSVTTASVDLTSCQAYSFGGPILLQRLVSHLVPAAPFSHCSHTGAAEAVAAVAMAIAAKATRQSPANLIVWMYLMMLRFLSILFLTRDDRSRRRPSPNGGHFGCSRLSSPDGLPFGFLSVSFASPLRSVGPDSGGGSIWGRCSIRSGLARKVKRFVILFPILWNCPRISRRGLMFCGAGGGRVRGPDRLRGRRPTCGRARRGGRPRPVRGPSSGFRRPPGT
jgi:hypothetical protein